MVVAMNLRPRGKPESSRTGQNLPEGSRGKLLVVAETSQQRVCEHIVIAFPFIDLIALIAFQFVHCFLFCIMLVIEAK